MIGGRAASMARRRAISLGKAALAPAPERVRDGSPGAQTARTIEAEAQQIDNAAKASYDAAVLHVTGDSPVREGVVTGAERGAAREITGTPYQRQGNGALGASFSGTSVTGDAPVNASEVTGTSRGAERDVTGTPYYRAQAPAAAAPSDPVASVASRFSVVSPQRSAQLRAASNPALGGPRVTGSCAVAHEKVTGNLDFATAPRKSGGAPARTAVTGEGSTAGARVTGIAWSEHPNVTGTEGATASSRNPSERAGRQHTFAGARTFKALASHEEPKHLVTGTFGYSSDSAAKVTLSGGAQG